MQKNDMFPHVFQPLTIRGLTLKNRLQYAPTVVLKCSPEGEVVGEMIDYVKWQARTGVAFLTIGNTPIVHEDSSAWLCEMDVTSDRCIHGMAQLVNAARENGAEISVELAHAGRGSHTTPGHPALAPSKKPLPGHSADDIKEMDRADMDYIKQQFCDCALRCKKAGMKIVMIHCAHHNLLAQFVSPDSNIRTDEYGGSLENRMRYPLEVLKAVRETVGEDMVIEMRVSAQEDTPGGYGLEEGLRFMEAAQEYVDIMHVSRGNIHGIGAIWTIPTYFRGRQLNVEFAAEAKKRLRIPVAVVGNITSLSEAEEIIAGGKADIVAMAKAYMADEQLVKKTLDGRPEDVRPCTRCDKCGWHNRYGLSMRCAVNPKLGLDIKTHNTAVTRKKVMVIGGGPGGMMAAQTLSDMGHEVTLYEKTGSLVGLLRDATLPSFKEYLRLYLKWDVRETERSGARIVYNTEVTADMVERENPDAVVVATGSSYIKPDVPGADLPCVKSVAEVHRNSRLAGDNVVVCGAGNVGLDCALMLAMEGKKVTVIDMIPTEDFYTIIHGFNGLEHMDRLNKLGVKLQGDRKITGFRVGAVDTVDSQGKTHSFEADTFVLALGVKPDNRLANELLAKYPRNVYVIGDCVGRGRTIYEANQEGFYAALSINRE
jgi:2,4-dienoyl-CoA reductase-like NADH-dependent reductase (Old Yellow Enzyme family)/thioredoxin reductase